MILYVVLDCNMYRLVYITLCSCVFLTVWQDCMFSFVCGFDGYEQYGRGSDCA